MEELLEEVRKSCLPALWSQGVKLARDGAVGSPERAAGTVTVRVRAPGHAVAPSVVLYVDDAEWACDCGSKVDPCAHVAAAAIVVSQLAQKGAAIPVAVRTEARLVYRLARQSGGLLVSRTLQRGTTEEPLSAPLTTLLARGTITDLTPTHDDLTIDRLLAAVKGPLPAMRAVDVIVALASTGNVTFEGKKVTVMADKLLPRIMVEDAKEGVVLRMERAPGIDEVLVRGVARCGETLRPLGEMQVTGEMLERLPLTKVFAKGELGELVTKILPELEERIPVIITSRKLPRRGGATRPRIQMELTVEGHSLSVVPTIVYGEPPQARIDDGKLVQLGKAVPSRDESAERRLVLRLRDELNLVPGRRVTYQGKDAVVFSNRLKEWRGGDVEGGASVYGRKTLVPRVNVEAGSFDVVFEAEGEGDDGEGTTITRRADAAAVVRAWQEGLGLAPLEGGGWAPLPEEWLALHGHRVADLLAAKNEDGDISPAVIPTLAALCDALEAPRPPSFERLAPLVDGFAEIPEAPIPADLTAELRPYQHVGLSWLAFLRDAGLGAVLADDMGLGKTLQTLCALKGRVLVVSPKSVVHNWHDEIRRFRPSLQVALYHGPKRVLDPTAEVTLTTYSVLRMDAEELANEQWDIVVLDEAQAIKNPDSQVARAAYGLRGDFRVALSGTPVENRLEELWSLLHFTNPGLLGGRSDFKERYEEPIAAGNPEIASRLRQRVRPFLLRRLKREVAPELPPRTDTVLHVELDEEERNVYDAVRAATKKDVVAKLSAGGSVLAALEALLRLRQAACHSGLVPGQHAESSSKVEALLEALEDAAADGHKALVFSQWTALLDRIEPHLRNARIPFTRLDGSTVDRASVVNAFQAEDGPPVMLASLKAGGTGLNLTAADHVFLMDPWWNPAAEDQAADRAHRIGQDRPVLVYRMVAKDTVEEGILALQERKRALADAALAGGEGGSGITRDDLLALLQ